MLKYPYKFDISHKYPIFGVISDQWEELENYFWVIDLDFLCISYVPNFSFLSVTVLEIRRLGFPYTYKFIHRASSRQL